MANYLTTGILGSQFDVASVLLGSDWTIPTQSQFQELFNTCTKILDPNGITFSNNGNSITLPYSGAYGSSGNEENPVSVGDVGLYWTSTPDTNKTKAINYTFNMSATGGFVSMPRFYGFTIRPVSLVHGVDLGLSSGTKWADKNVGATSLTDTGIYVAFGEVTLKSRYDWNSYMCTQYLTGTQDDPLYAEYQVIPSLTNNQVKMVTWSTLRYYHKKLMESLEVTGFPPFTFNGVVTTFDTLPTADLKTGQIYLVKDEDINYVWISKDDSNSTEDKWYPLGGSGEIDTYIFNENDFRL